MEFKRLGKSGLKISELSFGAWVTFANQLDAQIARECMKLAYDAGVNFFDNAEVYAKGEAERMMGKIIKDFGWARDSFCVSSKAFWGGDLPTQKGLSRKHLFDACHEALKRLQVDYLDLFFCHRPDPETPISETVRAMNTLVEQGKVLYWGTSEWSAEDIEKAIAFCTKNNLIPPTMEQPQYNLFHRHRMEVEYMPLFTKYRLGATIWSPLASGILTGKYDQGIPADSRMNLPGYEWLRANIEGDEGREKIDKTRKLSQLAKDLEMTLPQLAVAWCLKNSHVSTVILGASKARQLDETLKSIDYLRKLDMGVMKKIDGLAG